jgi:hypothetical protein
MKIAKVKKVTIQAFLPDLASGFAYQDSRGSGGSVAVAVKRAIDDLFANPKVSGRRIHSMKLTVAVVE